MRSIGGSWRCSTSGRRSRARPGGRRRRPAGRAIRDAEREREVLLRVSMANEGPLPQADLLALYRRLFARPAALEARDRERDAGAQATRRRRRRRPDLRGRCRVAAGPGSRRPRPAICTWAMSPTRSGCGAWLARSAARVLLRIEDHDRRAVRPEFDAALLEDLDVARVRADAGPVRQSDADAPYLDAAVERAPRRRPRLRLRLHAVDVRGLGRAPRPAVVRARLPGRCRDRGARRTGAARRARRRDEAWIDGLAGRAQAEVAAAGDLPIRDRHGNWTYGFTRRRRRPAPGHRPRRPRSRTCSTRRRPRSGSAGCSVARRRRRSSTTR